MYVIADQRIPREAIKKLSLFADVLLFSSKDITYKEVSGHPDIFFCQADRHLIAAPNTPAEFLKTLDSIHIDYILGNLPSGADKVNSTHYNAVVTQRFLIHHIQNTDPVILDRCPGKTQIHCRQGYTRCSLAALSDDLMITSDKGVSKVLSAHHIEHLLVDAENILLPGFRNGFFGGTCGFYEKKLFLTGSLNSMPEGEIIKTFVLSKGFEIIELYGGPLFDGGSLFFIE